MEKTDLAVNDDPAVVFGAVLRGFLHCVELCQRRHPRLPFFLAASVNQPQRETHSWIGYQIFSPPVSLSLFSFLFSTHNKKSAISIALNQAPWWSSATTLLETQYSKHRTLTIWEIEACIIE